jgi:hypothetical protein
MTAAQALGLVETNGIVLESAQGPVPSLAEKVAGERIRGSWWSHPKGRQILHLSRVVRDSPEVLVCRALGGKVTYVHRRLWPALVLMAARFPKKRLAAIKEIHTPSGKHRVLTTPFPQWVPRQVLEAVHQCKEHEAELLLAPLLKR